VADDQNIQKRILDEAREQFFKFGYSRITMDDLASSLGISKKTLYKHFRSKEELIKAAIAGLMQEAFQYIAGTIHNPDIEFLERLKLLIVFIGNLATRVGTETVRELEREVPHVWNEFQELREKFILAHFRDFIREGVEKGMIRNDVNQEIILLIFVNSIKTIITPKVITEMPFSLKEAFDAIIKVIYNGILTEDYRL
jgi:AcrR family transcriptional regulator